MSEIIRYDEWKGKFNPAAIGMKCNIEQYHMLKRCSEKKDVTEWNKWRAANPRKTIWLCGVGLQEAWLEGAWLGRKLPVDAPKERGAARVHLEGSVLARARLDRADLRYCQLSGAHLRNAKLRDAEVRVAELCSADLRRSELQGSNFQDAHIEATNLFNAHLEDAIFIRAIVDSETLIETSHVSKKTDFTTVGLDMARVGPRLKVTLKDNIREKQWRGWCSDGKWWHRNVVGRAARCFWWVSDYGRSTKRILKTFFGLAALFAVAYFALPQMLLVNDKLGDIRGPLHALYFSIVTMTTLGFGDIHARADCWWGVVGQIVLMRQVILGYVLLGALVTRFAVMFSGSGPAAKLSKRIGQGNREAP